MRRALRAARIRGKLAAYGGGFYPGWSRSQTRARPRANILCPFRALSQRLRRRDCLVVSSAQLVLRGMFGGMMA